MSVAQAPETTDEVVVYRRRRNVELILILFAQALGFGGYVITWLNLYNELPPNLSAVAGIWFGLGLVAHLAVRFRAPWSDPVILPCVFLLNGLGLAMIARIDQIAEPVNNRAQNQLILTAAAVLLFVIVVVVLRDHRRLQRFPYLLFGLGMVLLLLPLVPGVGRASGGARIWIRVAGFNFQPAEVAKVVLAISFASYFFVKRDLLAVAGKRILGITFPRARDLGPIAIMWLLSLAIMIFQNDLGTAVLFFGLFTVMIYIATERAAWPILAGMGLVIGGFLAYNFTNHVPRRIHSWLFPFEDYDSNLQVISAQFGYAWGGLFGRGWGEGRPGLTPLSWSDFIAASVGEELGVLGLMGVILVYALIVARGMKTALICPDGFGKLLAGGLAATFGIQVVIIIGGITRMLPLTGLTTPFMSQGGSSLVANWIIVGIMLVISHRARMPHAATSTPIEYTRTHKHGEVVSR